jgi:AraC-like DNA-binding protein/quercetin dioxygenase-like cupin family protein
MILREAGEFGFSPSRHHLIIFCRHEAEAQDPVRGGRILLFDLRPSGRLFPHQHDELEVNLVVSGRASYLFKNRRVPLPAHSMIWLFPGQEHVLIDCSHDFSMWVVVFRQELVRRETNEAGRRLLRSTDPGEILCRHIAPRQADALSQVYHGAEEERDDLEFLNATLGYALVASWQAFLFSRESVPLSDVHPAVAKAARLVAHADSPMLLGPLAREAGLSAARLSRLFKRQTGTSLTNFRQRKCLERFLRLYRAGARYSLIEAALLAGFGSYPQFHRVFVRLMGINPAAYRTRVREKGSI